MPKRINFALFLVVAVFLTLLSTTSQLNNVLAQAGNSVQFTGSSYVVNENAGLVNISLKKIGTDPQPIYESVKYFV